MTAPALLVAIPLIVGILLGTLEFPGISAAALALTVTWGATAVALHRARTRIVTVGLVAGFAISGVILGDLAARDVRQPALRAWLLAHPQDGPVRVVGVLREDAGRGVNGISLTIDVTSIAGAPAHLRGGIRVTVVGALALDAADAWRGGRTVAADVLLREPLDYRDPGVPSDRERLARDGIALIGTIKSAALVAVIQHGNPISEAAAALRAFVRRAAAIGIAPWHERSAAVATAILIGDRGGLDPDDERRLQEAGTYHVIAISGGNIALLTALLVWGGRLVRVRTRPTAVIAIVLLAFYGYAAGLAPSVLRATLAGIVYLAGRATDHRGAALNAIAVAAAFAAVSAPLTLLDPGFVLSFGATLAIVVGAARIAQPDRAREADAGRLQRAGRVLARAALALLAATVCAEIALAPIGARLFGRVSIAGLVLNFLAIPLMAVIQVSALVTVALAWISPSAAIAGGWFVQAGTRLLLWSAELVDVAPWLVLDVPPPATWLMACWYAGWSAVLLVRSRAQRATAGGVVIVCGALILAGLPMTRAVSVPPPSLGWTRLIVFDVGQGDATLVQASSGATVLVDAGGAPGSAFDVGRRVTLPALWAFGVSRLDALVLTHGDPDHVGGAPSIVRALRPREIWDGIPVPGHRPMQTIRDQAARARIRWIERRAGEALTVGDLDIRVLNPPEPDWERRRVRNDDSIVLEIRVGDVAFVLPGDVTQAVEPSVTSAFTDASLVIVKAPHHGSAGSSSQAFVAALHPSAVIFSAGKRNPFGHPAPVIVDRYKSAGARVFSTGDDGAVVVETDGHQVVVWTWNARQPLNVGSAVARRH
jgi:competence protein ComEC